MTDATHDIMRDYAAMRWPRLNHKGRIWRMSGLLGWTERRTRALYNNEQGMRERADERAAVEALKSQEATDDLKALRARIDRLEHALAVSDEAFHGPQIDALRASLSGGGGKSGS